VPNKEPDQVYCCRECYLKRNGDWFEPYNIKCKNEHCINLIKISSGTPISKKFCSVKCFSEHNFYENIKNLPEKEKYYEMVEFRFNVYDFPNWFDLDLLKKLGWFSPGTSNKDINLKGVVRNHRLSRNYGWLFN
jgi:hypothetical protein